jgi:hypothetical protein
VRQDGLGREIEDMQTRIPALRPFVRRNLLAVTFILGFLAIISWFYSTNVTERYFFRRMPALLLLNNIFRTIAIFYLILIPWSVGARFLRFVERKLGSLRLNGLDSFIVCFVTGAASLTIILLIAGYLNLYYRWLIASFTLACVIAGSTELDSLALGLRSLAGQAYAATRNRLDRFALVTLTVTFGLTVAALVICKGLYPGGYFDVFNHYLPYYDRVLDSHGIWPNDVYSQYYFSKGAGLLFQALLLTDLLAPSLVSFAFVVVSALALGSLVHKILESYHWAAAAMTVYLAGYIYTPTYHDLASNLEFFSRDALKHTQTFADFNWGYFQKHHTQGAAWICMIVWLVILFSHHAALSLRTWVVITCVAMTGLAVFAPTSMAVVLPFLLVMCFLSLCQGLRSQSRGLALVGAWGTIMLIVMCGINYWITGMPEQTPVRVCWQLANQRQFGKWVSPYEAALWCESSRPEFGTFVVPDGRVKGIPLALYLATVSRAEILRHVYFKVWVLLAAVLASLVALVLLPPLARRWAWECAAGSVALLVPTALVAAITHQPVSLYRNFEFCMFFSVLIGITCYGLMTRASVSLVGALRRLAEGAHPPRWATSGLSAVCLAVMPIWVSGASLVKSIQRCPRANLRQCVGFAFGRRTVADAYRAQGAMDDDLVAIYRQVGEKTHVWKLNWYVLAPAPHFWLETSLFFRLGADWHTIMFEDADTAKRALVSQDRNYFVINMSRPIDDILRNSALFCPANISRYLAIAYESPTGTYLLTWPNSRTKPITEEFLASYRKSLATPLDWDADGIYNHLRSIYLAAGKRAFPVPRSFQASQRVLQ